MRVAITTDWLNSFGGAERVLNELVQLFPDAPIYTSVYDPRRIPQSLRDRDVRTSFLQKVPLARRRHQAFFPLMPLAFEQFDLSEFDVVLTTSSACSKGVLTGAGTLNLCYCYTPPRYLWDLYHEHVGRHRARMLIAPVAQRMRQWDRMAADRVDRFIAISHEVGARIRKHYRRDSEVIYPPVRVDRFSDRITPPEDYYLVVSRLVRYKRIDLAIEAANRLGRRLLVVGDGPERKRLEAMAGPTVEILGWRPDAEVTALFSGCRGFLFPGQEDFGIAPVEAQAAGRPVVAYGRGGAVETVVHGKTGLLFDEQTVESLADAILTLERWSIDPKACRRNAERFDASVFRERVAAAVRQVGVSTSAAVPSVSRDEKLRETA